MTYFCLSSYKITVLVGVDKKAIIVESPPIVKKFIGQPLINLGKWMKKQGGFRMGKIESCDKDEQ